MKNNNFEHITDAYQLTEGAKIKGKSQEEIFELGSYDPIKRGYNVYPFEEGVKYDDFSVLMSEKELMANYLVENSKGANKIAA
jgi:hypothetical protein